MSAKPSLLGPFWPCTLRIKKFSPVEHASKAKVMGKIVQQGRSKKVTVLKFKKTNQYKISRGHRQNYTAVQVSDITL